MAASEVARSNRSEWERPHSGHAPTVGSAHSGHAPTVGSAHTVGMHLQLGAPTVGMHLQSGRHGPTHIGSPDAYTMQTGTHHNYLIWSTPLAAPKRNPRPPASHRWQPEKGVHVLLSYCNTVLLIALYGYARCT